MSNQDFDCDGYYIINYEGSSGFRHFLLALLILGVLLVCMFPVWPMWAKIGIWYLSVIFLTFYFGLLILRMVLFTIFWIVGFDFWIFPNLNDEYAGFLDSFQPFYSWEKRKDDILMLLVRFGSLAMVAVAAEQISQTTSFADVQDFVISSYADVIDWGVEKLLPPVDQRAALPSVKDLDELVKDDENDTEANDDDDDDDDTVDVDAVAPKTGDATGKQETAEEDEEATA